MQLLTLVAARRRLLVMLLGESAAPLPRCCWARCAAAERGQEPACKRRAEACKGKQPSGGFALCVQLGPPPGRVQVSIDRRECLGRAEECCGT